MLNPARGLSSLWTMRISMLGLSSCRGCGFRTGEGHRLTRWWPWTGTRTCRRRQGRRREERLDGWSALRQDLRRVRPYRTRLIPWTGNRAQGPPRDRHDLGVLAQPDAQLRPGYELIHD